MPKPYNTGIGLPPVLALATLTGAWDVFVETPFTAGAGVGDAVGEGVDVGGATLVGASVGISVLCKAGAWEFVLAVQT